MCIRQEGNTESSVTIIIATAGLASRVSSLLAAIESLEGQEPRRPQILVVLNGPKVAPDLRELLGSRSTVDLVYSDKAGLPNALNYGRRRVNTPYFGFLDDDDIYLPRAVAARTRVLLENPDIDVVATNGYVQTEESRIQLLPESVNLEKDPMEELFRQNWLASCGGLFRSSTVGPEYFPVYAKYCEWTMSAFLLSLDRNIHYLSQPTFVINSTVGSLSATDEYVEAFPGILHRMLDFPVESHIRPLIRERLSRALHDASVRSLERGDRRRAWRYHIDSLFCRGGAKYLPYTRKLL